MYTRDIKSLVSLGKSGVRWEAPNLAQSALESLNRDNTVADMLKKAEQVMDEIINFQSANSPDPIVINRALARFAEILKKIDVKNTSDRNAVLSLIAKL